MFKIAKDTISTSNKNQANCLLLSRKFLKLTTAIDYIAKVSETHLSTNSSSISRGTAPFINTTS